MDITKQLTEEYFIPTEQMLSALPRDEVVDMFRAANISNLEAFTLTGKVDSVDAISNGERAEFIGAYLSKTAINGFRLKKR